MSSLTENKKNHSCYKILIKEAQNKTKEKDLCLQIRKNMYNSLKRNLHIHCILIKTHMEFFIELGRTNHKI